MPNQFTPLAERFAAGFIPEPNSGCWLWTGWTRGRPNDPRPFMRDRGRYVTAYRAAWEMYRGPIPAGAFICHKCDVSLCVNPDHLYVGDAFTNMHDKTVRGRHWQTKNPELAREFGRALAKVSHFNRGRELRTRKIPSADLTIIRARIEAGESYAEIGSGYGVTKNAVYAFLRRAALSASPAQEDGK